MRSSCADAVIINLIFDEIAMHTERAQQQQQYAVETNKRKAFWGGVWLKVINKCLYVDLFKVDNLCLKKMKLSSELSMKRESERDWRLKFWIVRLPRWIKANQCTHICLLEICDACGKCNKNANKFSNMQRVRAINFAMHVFNEDALQYLHTYASPFTLRAHQLDRQRNGQRAVFSLWCPHTM